MKTRHLLNDLCLVVLVLALGCAAEEDSTSTASIIFTTKTHPEPPPPPPATIIFTTLGRASYAFDIYSLPVPVQQQQQQPLSPSQELLLTDGHSVNFNGHFLSNSSAIQLPKHSPPLQLVYVTERNGYPTIFYDAIYSSSMVSNRIQIPLLSNHLSDASIKDKPSVTPDGQYLLYVSSHENPGVPRASWTAVYSTQLESGLTQRLTPYGVADFSPSLSPSGLWTAVASYGPHGWAGEVEDLTTDIYVFLTHDGTHRFKIVEHGGWPTWVDDRTLYFHRRGQDHWWSIYRAILPSNAPFSVDSVFVERVTPPGLHAFTPSVVPAKVVEALLKACKSGNFDLANKEVNNFIAEGYPASQMLTQLFEAIVEENDLSDEQKARISKKLGEADKCLVDGADEYLQLLDAVSNTIKAFHSLPEAFAYEC
ncbi:Replication factor C subunit 4 [Glycine soja]|nr:Replication factor C subunit 4 [Glycine soja]